MSNASGPTQGDAVIVPGLVTVIVPCFAQAHFLPQAIDSVLAQTYEHIEIVVIDDGSPDDVHGALQFWAGDPRVRLVRQPNGGLPSARNAGLAHARGAFLQFLDADDWLAPEKLERQVELLRSEPQIGMAYCDFISFDDDTGVETLQTADIFASLADDPLAVLTAWCVIPPCVVLLRREWAMRLGPFSTDLVIADDLEYWLRLIVAGCRLGRVDGALAYYRRHAASLTAIHEGAPLQQELTEIRLRFTEAHGQLAAAATQRGFNLLAQQLGRRDWELRGVRAELESAKTQIAGKDHDWLAQQLEQRDWELRGVRAELESAKTQIARKDADLEEMWAAHKELAATAERQEAQLKEAARRPLSRGAGVSD